MVRIFPYLSLIPNHLLKGQLLIDDRPLPEGGSPEARPDQDDKEKVEEKRGEHLRPDLPGNGLLAKAKNIVRRRVGRLRYVLSGLPFASWMLMLMLDGGVASAGEWMWRRG